MSILYSSSRQTTDRKAKKQRGGMRRPPEGKLDYSTKRTGQADRYENGTVRYGVAQARTGPVFRLAARYTVATHGRRVLSGAVIDSEATLKTNCARSWRQRPRRQAGLARPGSLDRVAGIRRASWVQIVGSMDPTSSRVNRQGAGNSKNWICKNGKAYNEIRIRGPEA